MKVKAPNSIQKCTRTKNFVHVTLKKYLKYFFFQGGKSFESDDSTLEGTPSLSVRPKQLNEVNVEIILARQFQNH